MSLHVVHYAHPGLVRSFLSHEQAENLRRVSLNCQGGVEGYYSGRELLIYDSILSSLITDPLVHKIQDSSSFQGINEGDIVVVKGLFCFKRNNKDKVRAFRLKKAMDGQVNVVGSLNEDFIKTSTGRNTLLTRCNKILLAGYVLRRTPSEFAVRPVFVAEAMSQFEKELAIFPPKRPSSPRKRHKDTSMDQVPKVKILFLASDPFKQDPLALGDEVRAIAETIESASLRDRLELIPAFAVHTKDLQKLLLKHQPTIVHFSGHGTRAEQILLKDNHGRPAPVSKEALVGLFDALKDEIKVVVLNACDTKSQAEAISEKIDFAIGMNDEIGDDAAILFSAAFYQAIAFGRSVATAFKLGKSAIDIESLPDHQIPELHHRGNVKPEEVCLAKAL